MQVTLSWAVSATDLTRSAPKGRGMMKQQPVAPITPDRDVQELKNTPRFRYCSEDHSY